MDNEIQLFNDKKKIGLILKTAGNRCNLNCAYCFEKFKSVSVESISASLLKRTLKLFPNISSLTFHGGEPFIVGVKKFDELLLVIRDFYPKKIEYIRIQTNGTLITEEWIKLLFYKYSDLKIEIAISLDGYKELNSLRVDFSGKESFEPVLNAFKLLEKYKINAGLLSVVSKHSLGHEEEYVNFLSSISNLSFVKINALFNIHDEELSFDSLTPMEYAIFISNCMKFYIKSELYKRVAIEPMLSILQKINNKNSMYCNYSDEKCYQHLCLYPNGDVSPCDCLSVDSFKIFNVNDVDKQQFNFSDILLDNIDYGMGQELKKIISECNVCDIKDFCCAGCLSQRFYFRKNEKFLINFCQAKHLLKQNFERFKK